MSASERGVRQFWPNAAQLFEYVLLGLSAPSQKKRLANHKKNQALQFETFSFAKAH